MSNKSVCLYAVKVFLVNTLLFSFSNLRAEEENISCEQSILTTYMNYRAKLLASTFKISDALEYLKPDYLKEIKKEKVFEYFISLRITEARIIRVTSFHAKCTINGYSILRLKTINSDGQFDRRYIVLSQKEGQFFIETVSNELGSKDFDGDLQYVELE